MRHRVKFLVFLVLVFGVPLCSYAEEMSITLPDGTQRTVESRPAYSSSNPADSLMDAIALKDLNKVRTLVNGGVSVNSPTSSGEILLMEALGDDKAEILDFLLDHGADVNLAGNMAGIEITTLDVAVTGGYSNAIKKLLQKGADTEKEDIAGETPLSNAVRGGNLEIVKLLIEHGADINHKNLVGDTPLLLAEKTGKEDLVAILRKTKAADAS